MIFLKRFVKYCVNKIVSNSQRVILNHLTGWKQYTRTNKKSAVKK